MPDYTTEEKLALTEQMLAIVRRERDQARDAARQFFEASVSLFEGSAAGRAAYVAGLVSEWPWLRPNPYQGGETVKTPAV